LRVFCTIDKKQTYNIIILNMFMGEMGVILRESAGSALRLRARGIIRELDSISRQSGIPEDQIPGARVATISRQFERNMKALGAEQALKIRGRQFDAVRRMTTNEAH
jgi:hypothetical protein